MKKNHIEFHLSLSDRFTACANGRGWCSHQSFATMAEALAGTYVPPGWTVNPDPVEAITSDVIQATSELIRAVGRDPFESTTP